MMDICLVILSKGFLFMKEKKRKEERAAFSARRLETAGAGFLGSEAPGLSLLSPSQTS